MQRVLQRSLGLISLGLAILLSSCANQPAIKTQIVTNNVPVYVALPSTLTAQVAWPTFPSVVTNATMADYILALQSALFKANGQLDAIQKIQTKAIPSASTSDDK